MSAPPQATSHNNSVKILVLLPLRGNSKSTFQYETPCKKCQKIGTFCENFVAFSEYLNFTKPNLLVTNLSVVFVPQVIFQLGQFYHGLAPKIWTIYISKFTLVLMKFNLFGIKL